MALLGSIARGHPCCSRRVFSTCLTSCCTADRAAPPQSTLPFTDRSLTFPRTAIPCPFTGCTLPFTDLFADLSLPFTHLSPAFSMPFVALSLVFHCRFANLSPAFSMPFAALSLTFHRCFAAHPLPRAGQVKQDAEAAWAWLTSEGGGGGGGLGVRPDRVVLYGQVRPASKRFSAVFQRAFLSGVSRADHPPQAGRAGRL